MSPGRAALRAKLISIVAALSLALVAADRFYTRAVQGSATTSLLGRHTFAKAALIDAPQLPSEPLTPVERRLANLAEWKFSPIRRQLQSVSNRPHVIDILEPNYEVCLQYACTDNSLLDLKIERPQLDHALFRVGLLRLLKNPTAYATLTFDEYKRIWLLHPRKDPALAHEFNAYLSAAGPLPFRDQLDSDSGPVPQSEQSRFYHFDRRLFILIGIAVPVLTLALGIFRLTARARPILTAAFVYVIAVQAVLLFCCMGGIGTPRYLMGIWPMLVAAFAFTVATIAETLASYLRNSKTANLPAL